MAKTRKEKIMEQQAIRGLFGSLATLMILASGGFLYSSTRPIETPDSTALLPAAREIFVDRQFNAAVENNDTQLPTILLTADNPGIQSEITTLQEIAIKNSRNERNTDKSRTTVLLIVGLLTGGLSINAHRKVKNLAPKPAPAP